jgi:hypothetical protein
MKPEKKGNTIITNLQIIPSIFGAGCSVVPIIIISACYANIHHSYFLMPKIYGTLENNSQSKMYIIF